jgi:FkbM family methyltransferase
MRIPTKLAPSAVRDAIALRLWSAKQIHSRAGLRLWYLKQVLRGERELRLVNSLSDPNRLTLDIGANRGLYSIGAVRYSKGVVAFEPQPYFASFLRRYMPATVEVRECAVSDTTGTATLLMPADPRRHAEARLSFADDPGAAYVPTVVSTVRIDEIINDDVGLMKIDVEGHELAVLNGASKLIDISRPNIIIEIEDRHSPGAVSRAFQWFEGKQYGGFFLKGATLLPVNRIGPDQERWPYNFIFLPGERRPTMRPSVLAALSAVHIL